MSSWEPSRLVIDAGVGYALCLQGTAHAELHARLAGVVNSRTSLYAPSIWQYELTSIFTKVVHFRQMDEATAQQGLQLCSELGIQLVHPDGELTRQAFDWTRRLKRASAYDSFYLALAQRLGCELWTVDRKLANAVGAAWVRYVG